MWQTAEYVDILRRDDAQNNEKKMPREEIKRKAVAVDCFDGKLDANKQEDDNGRVVET